MANFLNRKQLQNASNEKIQEFFDSTIFHGSFSKEIKSTKNASYYKGSISNITLDGNLTNLCPTILNVPTSSSDIPEGPVYILVLKRMISCISIQEMRF